MPEPRKTFAPVLLLGVGAGILAAVASSNPWIEYADADARLALDPVIASGEAGQVPLATALSLVVLACWGVLLVTRRVVRRVVAVLGLVAAVAVAAAVVYAWFTLPDQQPEPMSLGGDGAGDLRWTVWFWAAAAASVISVVATALAVRWVRHWPEMGSRYDAPGAEHTEEKPAEDASSLELWKAMDEGRDPTE